VLRSPYQNRLRVALFARDQVEHVVHAVDQIDVSIARRPKHDLGALRPTLRRMTREVVRTNVRLGFDYPSAQLPIADTPN
jgi:hypothetical protein